MSKGKWKKKETVNTTKESPDLQPIISKIMMKCPRCSYEPLGLSRLSGICEKCNWSLHLKSEDQPDHKLAIVIG